MIINPNTVNIFSSLINDTNIPYISKYLYQNMIDYVNCDNEFFKKYHDKNSNIYELKYISQKLKILEDIIKDLTINVSFIKLNYSVRKIIYIFSIIEIYLMKDIPNIYYKMFKDNEIILDSIDFDTLSVEDLDIIFEQIYLKYYLVKKIYEENDIEGLTRLELINRKLEKKNHKNIFDLYLNNLLDLNYILTLTSNSADIHKYKSEFIANFIIKK